MGSAVVVNWRSLKRNILVTSAVFLGGCALMPASGPANYDIVSESTDIAAVGQTLPYALVKVTPEIIETLGRYEPRFNAY